MLVLLTDKKKMATQDKGNSLLPTTLSSPYHSPESPFWKKRSTNVMLIIFLILGLYVASNLLLSSSSWAGVDDEVDVDEDTIDFNTPVNCTGSREKKDVVVPHFLNEKDAQKLLDAENTEAEMKDEQIRVLTRHSRLKIVVIDTPNDHKVLRNFAGYIHKLYKPASPYDDSKSNVAHSNIDEIKIIVYGLQLQREQRAEILLWKNVEFIDIWEDLLKAQPLNQPQPQQDKNFWRPFVIQHALERFEKVLYLSNHMMLQNKLDEIEMHLNLYGSYFVANEGEVTTNTLKRVPMCNADVQGYVANSYAHLNYLAPQIHCAYRDCTAKEKKLLIADTRLTNEDIPEEYIVGLQCNPFPTKILRSFKNSDDGAHCYLHTREDLLFTPFQLKPKPVERKPEEKAQIWIALGAPTTSKGTNPATLPDGLPIMSIFIPSLLKTIPTKAQDPKFVYRLYLAFDEGDTFYDNPTNQKILLDKISQMTSAYSFSVKMVKSVQTFGWTTFLWNLVYQAALDDGFDYFYQVNDDLTFMTAGWSQKFTDVLKNNPVYPNLGVVGPRDLGNQRLFTQSFVHRTHYEIFGFLYPPIFKNWYSDDFITEVYRKAKSSFAMFDYTVQNTNAKGTRYSACAEQGAARLEPSKRIGEKLIDQYLALKQKK